MHSAQVGVLLTERSAERCLDCISLRGWLELSMHRDVNTPVHGSILPVAQECVVQQR
jgi:hypothetical protein